MTKLAKSLVAAALLLCAAHAQAVLVDLKAAAEPGGDYGESAWSVFSLLPKYGIDVDIYGIKNGQPAFAYLDSNEAGMGVCGALNATGTAKLNQETHSGTNLCNPSDDDNITSGEKLKFVFNEAVVIRKLWFNNNHDDDFDLDHDNISIFEPVIGELKTFIDPADVDLARGGDFVYAKSMSFTAGFVGYISYSDVRGDQFYLSALEISRVPEPGTLALLATALAGLGFMRRKLR